MFDTTTPVTQPVTWQRACVTAVASFATAAAGSYFGIQVGASLSIAAAALTGSAFIGYVLLFTSLCVAMLAALEAASRVGNYIASGQIDRDYKSVRNTVLSMFGKRKSFAASMPESQSELAKGYAGVKSAAKRTRTKVADSSDAVIARMRNGFAS